MAVRAPAPGMEVFDAYFRRADLDQDGRISGAEAVGFFQGSNLPKHILAQIWMHADQNRSGFLGRPEFYNALRLVTVAQSGRELTPDIVKAALFSPAASKIPAPQINFVPGAPVPQVNPGAPPQPQINSMAPSGPQNVGFRGPQAMPNMGATQQFGAASNTQFMRPSTTPVGPSPPMPVANPGLPGASVAGARPPNPNMSTEWLGGRIGGSLVGPGPPGPTKASVGLTSTQDGFGQAPSSSTTTLPPKPSMANDSKGSTVTGNGFASDSIFGGDVFSAVSSQPVSSQIKQDGFVSPTFSASSAASSNAIVPVESSTSQSSVKQSQVDALQGPLALQPSGGGLQRAPSLPKPGAPLGTTPRASTLSTTGVSAVPASGFSVGAMSSAPTNQSQLPWPRITQSDIQKYNAVFVEVDTDRDGKITGEQARNLFLSWRLPREVLKQVWDLSDQDNDSMLSLKEFCTALYLMERYREGRPLPAVLPSSIKFDEALLHTAGGQQPAGFGGAPWRPSQGLPPQAMPGIRPAMPVPGVRASNQFQTPQPDGVGATQPVQQKSRVPILEKHLVNQLSREEQNALNSKFQEATESEKKVEALEKEIMDSKEKIEFYRTKMQELVLYRSRCDNRLNEITERASADKREVESLGKKYEEKYKQVGELSTKLTSEEASFRDIQERKMELYNAIVSMEKGGTADGILQVRADRIQTDLEELVKGLNQRCKQYGLRVKPTALVELPFGWQPGIQEGAAEWDDDWDKFEDEGFMAVQEFTKEGDVVSGTNKTLPPLVWDEKRTFDEVASVGPTTNGDSKMDSPLSINHQRAVETTSSYAHSDDGSIKSAPGSPFGRSGLGSPSQELPASHFGKSSSADTSSVAKEIQSDHGGAASTHSGDKFDEPSWGATFTDPSDDVDSLWGFNAGTSKDSVQDHQRKDPFFDDMGLNPIRTDSLHADSLFGKKTAFPFGDSVPGTPLFNSGNSPRFSEASDDHAFNAFARFDSFNPGGGRESLARFDSIRSTRDSDQSRSGFMSFDDHDPFAATGPFKFDPHTPRGGASSDKWSSF
ncbi:hypothetical protein AMTRI_Chr09g14120 [Amborella trichopoda]